MSEKVLCGNHGDHLITLGMINMFGISLLNNLYASANFLRTHWQRLLSAIDVVAADIEVVLGPPPPEARPYRECVIRQYKRGLALLEQEEDAAQPQKRRRVSVIDKNLREYFSVYNGPLWKQRTHYCLGPECCKLGKFTTVTRARNALRRTVCRSMPVQPVHNKWTKHSQCIILLYYHNL